MDLINILVLKLFKIRLFFPLKIKMFPAPDKKKYSFPLVPEPFTKYVYVKVFIKEKRGPNPIDSTYPNSIHSHSSHTNATGQFQQ